MSDIKVQSKVLNGQMISDVRTRSSKTKLLYLALGPLLTENLRAGVDIWGRMQDADG